MICCLIYQNPAGVSSKMSLRQLKSATPRTSARPKFCHTGFTPLSGIAPVSCQNSVLFMFDSPQLLCSPFCEKLGVNLRLQLEEDTNEDDDPFSLWTSSVLKKRRKKMNKHKYKKRKRRDRYKTKLK